MLYLYENALHWLSDTIQDTVEVLGIGILDPEGRVVRRSDGKNNASRYRCPSVRSFVSVAL